METLAQGRQPAFILGETKIGTLVGSAKATVWRIALPSPCIWLHKNSNFLFKKHQREYKGSKCRVLGSVGGIALYQAYHVRAHLAPPLCHLRGGQEIPPKNGLVSDREEEGFAEMHSGESTLATQA